MATRRALSTAWARSFWQPRRSLTIAVLVACGWLTAQTAWTCPPESLNPSVNVPSDETDSRAEVPLTDATSPGGAISAVPPLPLLTSRPFAAPVVTGAPVARLITNDIHVRPLAVTTITFEDGTIAHLDVGAPWWSWLWGGLIYQPFRGELTTFKNVSVPVHPWWCLWLCTETGTVQQPVRATSLVVNALGFTGNNSGEQTTDQGEDYCTTCSSVTHYVHNFGFPAPPWAGGGGFKGIGFRGHPTQSDQSMILHDHWGSDRTSTGAPAFPPDFD